ncbi:MAG: beta-lactamase family protein [Bacteroidia bacterium]|nr:beta-lactamase family protein [Bacteroidia bacterium]
MLKKGLLAIVLVFGLGRELNLKAQQNKGLTTEQIIQSRYHSFTDSTKRKIEAFFDYHQQIGNFNGTYLMFSNDSIIYGSRGYAIYSNLDSVEPGDLFQLASVSKIFTAMSVMMLHQDGYLNIDDSVHWYIPELENKGVTIRQLLSHTSGLPDYFYADYPKGFFPEGQTHMTNEQVVEVINLQGKRKYTKQGFYHYCNTNYAFLSLIVERLSHKDFRTFVRDHICKSAEMKYSHIANFDSLPLVNYPVQGYNKWSVFDDNIFNGTTGDKGVYSNVFEMFMLDRALKGSYILHEATKQEMWTPQTVTSSDGYYSLGWRIKYIDGKKWVFHNGWWKGFRTYFWRCLDEDKSFVVLTNNVDGRFLSTLQMVHLLD